MTFPFLKISSSLFFVCFCFVCLFVFSSLFQRISFINLLVVLLYIVNLKRWRDFVFGNMLSHRFKDTDVLKFQFRSNFPHTCYPEITLYFPFAWLKKFWQERGDEKRAWYKSSLKRLRPTFFYWWTFTETANQNYFRSAILASSRACSTAVKEQWKAILLTAINCTFLRSCVLMAINCTFLRSCVLFLDVEYFSFYCIEGAQLNIKVDKMCSVFKPCQYLVLT